MNRKIKHLSLAFLLAGLALALTLSPRPTWADSPPTFLLMWGFGVDTEAPNFETCTAATVPCYAGIQGNGNGQFANPAGVAIDSAGAVYVADTANYRIQKLDSNGNYVTEWGMFGTGDSQFFLPFDVAVDSAGNVYVADYGNNRIQKFDSSGGFLCMWGYGVDTGAPVFEICTLATPCQAGISGSGNGQLSLPLGVAVDSSDNVYVADTSNNRIQKFSSSGAFQWAVTGSGDNQFDRPVGVAVDRAGTIYVAETGNHRIQKRNSDGDFLKMWGAFGSGEGQFNEPSGLAIDQAGNVYVADTNNDRIQKFNSEGDFVLQWGSLGGREGQFFRPPGLTVDNLGSVYVADGLNHRIQKFQLPPLSVIKTVSHDLPAPGQRITYTITVDNNGVLTATNAVISDTLPDGLEPAGSATLEGTDGITGPPPTLASGLTISVAQRITVTFPVTVNTGLAPNTIITNTAGVTSTEIVTPQTGSKRITINPVSLTLIKGVSNNIPNPSERITYTATVSNSGLVNATNAVISDTLPDGLTFIGPVTLEGTSGVTGTPPTLASGLTITAGTRITVTFPVSVNADVLDGTIIINTAAVTSTEVSSPQSDPELIIVFDTISPTFPITNPLTGSPLITPTLGVILDTARPVFEWYAAWDNGQVLTYILTLSSTLDSIGLLSSSASISTSQTSFTPTVDLPNGVYTWTIQAQDAAGNKSEAITPQSFAIQAAGRKIYLPIIWKGN